MTIFFEIIIKLSKAFKKLLKAVPEQGSWVGPALGRGGKVAARPAAEETRRADCERIMADHDHGEHVAGCGKL